MLTITMLTALIILFQFKLKNSWMVMHTMHVVLREDLSFLIVGNNILSCCKSKIMSLAYSYSQQNGVALQVIHLEYSVILFSVFNSSVA